MTLARVLRALDANPTNVSRLTGLVDALVATGKPEHGLELANALASSAHGGWAREAVQRHLLRQLALSTRPEHADALLQLVIEEKLGRTAVSVLVDCFTQSHGATALVSSLGRRHDAVDWFAQVLHSFICRGARFDAVAEVLVFRDELLEQGHPLAELPLSPTPLEAALHLTRYGASSSSTSGFSGPRPGLVTQPVSPAVAATRDAPAELGHATASWSRHESKVLTCATPPAGRAVTLASLPLQSVRGGGLVEVESTGAEVFARLFAAAASGGAYSSGAGNALGRLAAFDTLGALCGATGPVSTLERAAHSRLWLFGGTPWFWQVAWDLGVACLWPDGVTLVVHAATDTD